MEFEEERLTYKVNNFALGKTYPGQWVAIKGEEILGIYLNQQEAQEDVDKLLKGEPYFLKQIESKQ